jgi:ribosomal protein S18 acetylase RimI-like enzyme
MNKATIRKGTLKDYDAVMRLYELFITGKKYESEEDDSYQAVINHPDTHIEIAVVDETIVGFITYSLRSVVRYPKPIVEVEEFFVLEEYRHLKIGKELMDHVFDFAKEKNSQYVFLASGMERVSGQKFYKKYGFDKYAYHYRKEIRK